VSIDSQFGASDMFPSSPTRPNLVEIRSAVATPDSGDTYGLCDILTGECRIFLAIVDLGARTAQLTEWQLLVIVEKLNPTLNVNMQVI